MPIDCMTSTASAAGRPPKYADKPADITDTPFSSNSSVLQPRRSASNLRQIASAIGVIVQVNRLTDGRRKVMSISELTGMEGEVITMQDVFTYRQTGVDTDGTVKGYFQATGVRPRFMERLKARGISLPETLFDPERRME